MPNQELDLSNLNQFASPQRLLALNDNLWHPKQQNINKETVKSIFGGTLIHYSFVPLCVAAPQLGIIALDQCFSTWVPPIPCWVPWNCYKYYMECLGSSKRLEIFERFLNLKKVEKHCFRLWKQERWFYRVDSERSYSQFRLTSTYLYNFLFGCFTLNRFVLVVLSPSVTALIYKSGKNKNMSLDFGRKLDIHS